MKEQAQVRCQQKNECNGQCNTCEQLTSARQAGTTSIVLGILACVLGCIPYFGLILTPIFSLIGIAKVRNSFLFIKGYCTESKAGLILIIIGWGTQIALILGFILLFIIAPPLVVAFTNGY